MKCMTFLPVRVSSVSLRIMAGALGYKRSVSFKQQSRNFSSDRSCVVHGLSESPKTASSSSISFSCPRSTVPLVELFGKCRGNANRVPAPRDVWRSDRGTRWGPTSSCRVPVVSCQIKISVFFFVVSKACYREYDRATLNGIGSLHVKYILFIYVPSMNKWIFLDTKLVGRIFISRQTKWSN